MKIFEFIREVKTEVGRIAWPTNKEIGISVGLVFVMVFISGLFFLAVDALLFRIIALILG